MKKNGVEPNLQSHRALRISGRGEARVGPVLAIPDIVASLGVSPQRVFAQAGVDPRLFEDPENRVSLDTLGTLLETGVALTGCAHLGLLVGARCELKSFGPLGYLMKNAATLGAALRCLLLHLHLDDAGGAPLLLASSSSSVVLGYSIYRHDTRGMDLILDAVAAIGYRILAELCGPDWQALRVQFSRLPPDDIAPWRRVLGSSVSFEADVSGIVFESSWLDRPIDGADPALHGILARTIRKVQVHGLLTFADQVERVLPQMVLSGMASAPAVAALFAIHERTLRRRLEAEGKGLQQLINQARFELAQQLLANTALSVAEIAAALRYDDPNVFSRAFRNWAKMSPTQWRALQ